jgi:hypothetical protein
MENKNFIVEEKTESFNFQNHFVNALLGSLYYILAYIPFILPFIIWSKAATRISLIWERKTLRYDENNSAYPSFSFYFQYFVNFLFDASIFLSWFLGFLLYSYLFFIVGKAQTPFLDYYLIPLYITYASVIMIRLSKESFFYILNVLLQWLLQVIINIGMLIKNMWLINFVYRKKGE